MKVDKATVRVIVFTPVHRLEGTMYTYRDARILDELNATAKSFIPLTDVQVYPANGEKLLYKVGFLALNKAYITHLLPRE